MSSIPFSLESPQDFSFSPVPKPAWKMWKYLESLGRIGGWIAPSVRFLARHFQRSESTIKRWLGMLFRAGILATTRRGPRPPLYRVLIPTTDTCKHFGPITKHLKELESAPPEPRAQKISRYLGQTRIAGKTADRPLIQRIARLVGGDEGLERFKSAMSRWFKRGKPAKSWGIAVCLAECAAREPEPPPPLPPEPQFVDNREESAGLLAGLGINAGAFGFGGRR